MLEEIRQSIGFYITRAYESVTKSTYRKCICHIVVVGMVEPESIEQFVTELKTKNMKTTFQENPTAYEIVFENSFVFIKTFKF